MIKVIADTEFINAPDRTFPVIIDPQIIDQKNIYEGVTIRKKTEELYDNEKITIEEGSNVRPEARDDGSELVESDIHYKAPTSITDGHIVGAKLVMGIDTGMGEARVSCITTKGERIYGTGPALLRTDIFNAGMNDTDIEFDVGIGGEGDIAIRCENYSNGRFDFELYIPYFVVDYIEVPEAYRGQEFNANNPPMIKDFDFTDKATGHVYAKYGTLATSFKSFDAEDFVLPLNISHCHKVGIGKTEFGMDWRLNLNRKLKSRGSSEFLYIDELGDRRQIYF